MLTTMELNSLREFIAVVNPWIESTVLFLVYVLLIIIVARLSSDIFNRILHYFDIKNEYFPESLEYIIYMGALVVMLLYFGVFKLAIIILLGLVVLTIILALLYTAYGIIPEFVAGRRLAKKELNIYGKVYKKGMFSVKYAISDYETLIVPNKTLLNDLDRRLS
jgi:hypothetical protein